MDHRHVDGAARPFDASLARADIGRSALGIRLQQKFEAKLGRCTRCMTISAVSFIVAWALVVALAQLRPTPVVLLAAATVIAVLFSGVALAHTLAYAMHRRGGVGTARVLPAAGTTPQRRGCGCGSNTA
ncbi:MAG: DUF3624 family protein [Ilumatobacteraceae bacterium]